jgi:hypothetical protein
MFMNDSLVADELCGEAATAPLVFDCTRPGHAERLNHLIGSGQVRSLHDTIDSRSTTCCASAPARSRPAERRAAAGRAAVLAGAAGRTTAAGCSIPGPAGWCTCFPRPSSPRCGWTATATR